MHDPSERPSFAELFMMISEQYTEHGIYSNTSIYEEGDEKYLVPNS